MRYFVVFHCVGSERVKETKPHGEAFAESQNINKSLLTLGKISLLLFTE